MPASRLRFGLAALAALLLAYVTAQAVNPPGAPPDHFLSFKTKRTKGAPKFVRIPGVRLVDGFEDVRFDLTAAGDLLPPAGENGAPPSDAVTHLRAYKIKAVKGSPKHVKRLRVPILNHLGSWLVDTAKPDLLLVPTAVDPVSPPPPPNPSVHHVDHYKCYLVKRSKDGAKIPPGLQATVTDPQTGAAKVFGVSALKRLCLPVDKDGAGVENPGGAFACFTVKPAKGQPKHVARRGLQTNNQLGALVVDTVKETELCVPSTTPAPTPTPGGPTATSATPSPTGGGGATPTPDLPPDPEDVAPAVDAAVASVAALTTRFLYEGDDPIQSGVAQNAIDERRAAVLRGRVLDHGDQPLAGVRITILGHPELGETATRADGVFDLAVNGGAMLTVRYDKPPFLPVQRQADVPWQEFVVLPDVMLTPLDAAVTAIDLDSGAMQAARGSVVSDADGTRRTTLLFPAGTTAMMIDAEGQQQPIGQLAIRATEFTVGANGPKSMPGDLPASSAYTYAVELSADEAIAAGAREVVFSEPIFHYVENFLEFPVGTVVPTGFYDRERGVWEPSANGLVIAIVGVTSGRANLDLDGNGTADDGTAIGVTDAERQQLAALYAPGQELWRVPIPHFSIVDCNWPFVLPDDATGPESPPALTNAPIDQCVEEQAVASIVECQNQTLGQSVPIVGTPFALNYRSDRVPGREGARVVTLVASGATVPASLERIDVELQVAGQRLTQTLPPNPNQTVTFTWDGRDAYGRTLQGSQPFRANIGFVYGGVYATPAEAQQAFAAFGATPISADRAREQITVGQVLTGALGGIDARGTGLGGWTLDVHHAYDPEAKVVYLGNGRRIGAGAIRSGVATVAGGGSTPATTGLPAKSALFAARPFSLVFTADGALFFSIPEQHRIGRVTPDGVLSIFGGGPGFGGDGQLLGFAQFANPRGVTVGADGVGYIADSDNHRVRRVEPSGIISTFAGNGTQGFSGDDGSALDAELSEPDFVAVGPDGSVYVADGGNDRIRRIGTDGIINTIAGGGATCCNDLDGIPARDAALNNIGGLVVDARGIIYVANDDTILRIGPDGIMSRVAGDFFAGCDFTGDDGPALLATLCQPTGLALDRDGRLYVGDRGNDRVRVIGADGIISTVLGGGADGTTEEAPATQARLDNAQGPAIAPDGSLHAVGSGPNRIRRLQSSLPAFAAASFSVASEDAGSIYQFDAVGRHLQTLDSLTGGLIYQFTYDGDGRLAAVSDGDSNTTTIVRDANGVPTAIVAPFGQETTLALDANGFLAGITNPANETVAMTYTPAGLLTTFADPLNHVATYDYDDLGRLESAEDPAGGSLALARTEIAGGHQTTRTTELGRISTDRVERSPAGDEVLTSTLPDGSGREVATDRDGLQTVNFAHGTATTSLAGPDPRFGLEAPVATSFSTHLPSTLAFEGSGARTAVLSDPDDPLSLQTLTQTTTVNGKTSVSTYATVSRTFTTTTAAGRTHTATLDDRGRLVQSQFGDLDPVSVAYDGRGRIASTAIGSGPGARTTMLTYDDDGFLETITDPLDRVASFAWDAAGRLTAKTLPDGKVVGFGYDAAGNATSVTPPGRGAYVHAYSPQNELTIFTPPAAAGSGPTTTGYDTDRAVASVDRGGVHTAAIAYDAAGRPATRTLTSGGGAPAIDTFAYDGVGRLAGVTTANGVVFGYGYDGILPVTSTWSGPVTGTVGRTYDTTFRLASQSVNGANPLVFAYDADGLLTGAGDLVIVRDPEHGLGTGSTLGVVATSRTFNGAGEMTSYAATANASPLFAQTYTRDAIGRVTTKVETVSAVTDTYTYGFDLAGQLTSVLKNGNPFESHVYDSNGNRTSTTVAGDTDSAAYDALDRLTEQGGVTYAHDAAGDRIERTAGAQTTTYGYDAVGNLVEVGLPDGTTIGYLVDGVGRRVGRSIDGTLVQGLYDDLLRPVAELDGTDAVVSRFVYSAGTTPAYMLKGGATLRLVADQIGSVRLVVNAASGAVVQRLDYDAFGNVLADTNPGFQPFGYAGGLYDPATKLVHFGVRDYDPETGRWTARDPLGFRGNDHNLYRYCANDPVNRLDPSGLDNWDAAVGFIEQMNEEIQMVNPVFALNILIDSTVKAIASALGFDPGPTMRETIFHSGPTIADRKSEDYATGELAAVCVGTIGQLASGAAVGKLAAREAALTAETLARQGRIAERVAARDGQKIPFSELSKAAAEFRDDGQRFAHQVQKQVAELAAGWRTGGGGSGIGSGGGW